ncbi:hypothetical protein BJX66DRAFT_128625 [Aspergillus keveii]|uniref:Uncharacterized protein n=1 Tax=Aspergillus keveii TaxID=714993 RepID=A0ABR4GDU3_9EURO
MKLSRYFAPHHARLTCLALGIFEPPSLDVVGPTFALLVSLHPSSIPHLFPVSSSNTAKRKRNSESKKQRRRTKKKDNCISLVLEEVIYLSLVTYTLALLIPSRIFTVTEHTWLSPILPHGRPSANVSFGLPFPPSLLFHLYTGAHLCPWRNRHRAAGLSGTWKSDRCGSRHFRVTFLP